MRKMKLAITPRYLENEGGDFIVIKKKYYPFFKKYNITLYLIPFNDNKRDIKDFLSNTGVDMILFAGGYKNYTKEIKRFETNVLKIALENKLPIFGICCGMWTINYHFKGTLRFDYRHEGRINKATHKVKVIDLIRKGAATVNSYHSKVIDKLGDGLTPFILAEDNTIEGFYNKEKKIIGIQFHMENYGVDKSLTKQIMKKFEEL